MGSPACVVVSRGFSRSAQAIARSRGCAGLPIIEMEHPLTAPSREALHSKTDAIVEEVFRALTGNADALRAEYREKKLKGPRGLCPK